MESNKNSGIVFLTSGGPLYWIVANALVEAFGPLTIIQEQPEPKKVFLKRRVKKLGLITTAGQAGFNLLSRLIRSLSNGRREILVRKAGGNWTQPPNCPVIHVESVNSPACREAIKLVDPAVVVVVGTRIIGAGTLQASPAPFINYHPGLTPKYRGLNGAYWTLWNRDRENLANTVHLVDENVDTGGILYQEKLDMPPGNNITTYHYYMAALAGPLVIRAVRDVLAGTLQPKSSDLPSRQWYHPTLWGYVWGGLTRKVW